MNPEWNDFFVAILGAAAALAGLIFVGVSISLSKILSNPTLPGRASESLILLVTVLITSGLFLVPGQSLFLRGNEVLCIGVIIWIVTFRIDLKMLRNTPKEYTRHYRQNMAFTQLALLPYLISGILMMMLCPSGIYWLVPGILLSFVKSVVDAWVLLVEINR